jgi:hypothetical protein
MRPYILCSFPVQVYIIIPQNNLAFNKINTSLKYVLPITAQFRTNVFFTSNVVDLVPVS